MPGWLNAVLGGAVEGVGRGMSQAGAWQEEQDKEARLAEQQRIRDDRVAEIQKNRDELLEKFATAREGRQYAHAETMQQQGFAHAEQISSENRLHAEKLQEANQKFELARQSSHEGFLTALEKVREKAHNGEVIGLKESKDGNLLMVQRDGTTIETSIKLGEAESRAVAALSTAVKAAEAILNNEREAVKSSPGKTDTEKAQTKAKIADIDRRSNALFGLLLEGMSREAGGDSKSRIAEIMGGGKAATPATGLSEPPWYDFRSKLKPGSAASRWFGTGAGEDSGS